MNAIMRDAGHTIDQKIISMPYTVRHDRVLDIIEVIYISTMSKEDLLGATKEALALHRQTGTLRFLSDVSGAVSKASFLDLLQLAETQYDIEQLDRRCSHAIIPSQGKTGKNASQFFETASLNRGWNTKVFSDRKSAIDWLLKSK